MSNSQWRDEQWPAELTPFLYKIQVVTGAMVAGCVMFLIISLIIRGGQFMVPNQPMMTYVAFAFATATVFARMIVPGIIVNVGRKNIGREAAGGELPKDVADLFKPDGIGEKLCLLLQTSTIVSVGLFEGAAFFAIVVYFIEGSLLSVILAVALIFALMLHFPTRSRVIGWMERQLTEFNAFEKNV